MPVITVYHQPLLQGKDREQLAFTLTTIYREHTSPTRYPIKVVFVELDSYSIYQDGQRSQGHVGIIAEIPYGIDEYRKPLLLRALYEGASTARWYRHQVAEIETRVVEINERNAMINGSMVA